MVFNWFRRKRQAIRKPALVWVSQGAKYRGIGEAIKQQQDKGALIAIAHFPATLYSAAETLDSLGVSYRVFSSVYERLDLKAKLLQPKIGEVTLALAELLPEPFVNDPYELDPRVNVQMIAIEHYPVASKDQKIIDLADSLPFPTKLEFHYSLDEPLLKIFQGEKILEMISQFRVSEDMPLESGMLTRSLEKARARLSKRITTDIPAHSLSEWYDLNLPSK
jgi:hypothetical protein